MGLFKKKQSIDPVEFLVLRNELVELKERLDATEQAKASLEDRLSSLAATTMVLSSNAKSDTAEIVEKIESLEHRIDSSLDVGAKVDELHQRVIDVEQNAGAGMAAELEPRLVELSQRIDEVAELAAAPVAPDDELAGRLDSLTRSAQTVELLQQQIGQLNARISTQADLADQVTALSDRIGLLQQRNADSDRISQRLDELASLAGTEELAERLALLGQRVTATEEAARLTAEQATTRAELAEQLAALERRIADTGELAGRVGQLDERIAALSAASPDTASPAAGPSDAESSAALEARLAELDAQLQQQAALADRLAQLDEQMRAQAALAEQVAAIDERLAAIAAAPSGADTSSQAGNEGPATVDPAILGSVTSDLERLRQIVDLRSADVAGLRELIDVRSDEIAELRAQLTSSAERATLPPPVDGTAAPQVAAQQLGELAERVAITAEDARVARERAAALEERLAELDRATTERIDERLQTQVSPRLDQLAAGLGATDDLRGQLADLWQRVAASEQQAQVANEQAAALAQQLAGAGDLSGLSGSIDQRLGEFAARLDAQGHVDQQISEIWSRIVGAEEQTRSAHDRATSLEQQVAEARAAAAQANTDEIDRQLAELRQRLDQQAELPSRLAELDARLGALPDRGGEIAELQQRIGQLAASVPDTSGLQQQLASLSQRVGATEEDARTALRQALAIDERIQNVSTQLANQLSELSRDMDSLAERQPAGRGVDDEALQSLRSGQVKLAAEQARYEISFREDLAALAEQVRQLRGR